MERRKTRWFPTKELQEFLGTPHTVAQVHTLDLQNLRDEETIVNRSVGGVIGVGMKWGFGDVVDVVLRVSDGRAQACKQ